MAEDELKSHIPYLMSNAGFNNFEDYTFSYQGIDFECNNYHNNYRNEQYNNVYVNYNGGYSPDYGYNQNFIPPYSGFYGFPSHQHPPGPPQEPQCPPDLSSNVSEQLIGSDGPPVKRKQSDDKVIKALIRCGIPKEYLKNLPRNLLKLYQPDYCGLCSQGFDTAAISRMHYICKNHLKNEKKWLTQTDSGFRRNKELPLRARELFCEICDVHITSKVHSESHYSGKPHRAIVEGRKNPKNPFLMQRGMEDRLEQLIRRERKHLRLGEEEAPEKKEVKQTQPELFCKICETSVTCTEQMIMHLNGKRHLAREKQHILKRMRSGSVDAGNEVFDGRSEEESLEIQTRPDSADQMGSNLPLT